MKLYHFTPMQNLLLISWAGLKPDRLGKGETWQTGRPCVWLTRQENITATRDDVEFYAKRGDEIGIGEPLFGGSERATVHLKRQDRKLVPYREIATAEELASMQPRNRLAWWVYFGDIPPDKIEPITIAQALAGLDIHISIAKDFERRARYVAMRDRLLLQADDPSQPVRWNNSATMSSAAARRSQRGRV